MDPRGLQLFWICKRGRREIKEIVTYMSQLSAKRSGGGGWGSPPVDWHPKGGVTIFLVISYSREWDGLLLVELPGSSADQFTNYFRDNVSFSLFTASVQCRNSHQPNEKPSTRWGRQAGCKQQWWLNRSSWSAVMVFFKFFLTSCR